MAKMKVHELSKELNIPSKEILAFLSEKGVEAKAAQSSIDDAAVSLVKSKFGASAAAPAKAEIPAPAKAEAPAEASAKAEAPAAAPAKPATPAEKKVPAEGEAPKKKKKIIIVSNNNNSQNRGNGGSRNGGNGGYNNGQRNGNGYNNGQRNGGGNGGQRNGGRPVSQTPAYRPLIRSSVVPTEVTDDFTNRNRTQQPARPAQRPAQAQNTAAQSPAAETPAAASVNTAPVQPREQAEARAPRQNDDRRPQRNEGRGDTRNEGRNDRRNDGRNGQRSFGDRNGEGRPSENRGGRTDGRGGQGRQGFSGGPRPQGGPGAGGRSFGNNERGGRGNGGPGMGSHGAGSGKGFGGGAPMGDGEGKRQEQNRRVQNQDRDKKKRKDLIFEEDETKNVKKAGRFIKPEKKVEAPEEKIKTITIPESLTLKELAEKMKMQPAVIIKKLFLEGKVLTLNSEISFEDAENIAIDYEIICEKEVQVDVIEELLKEDEEDESKMVKRPPVVCVMGHVDHGKTSLLDAIRKTNVTDREAGGITQAIGAYTVRVNDEKITFLDTPGHEAFTAMRMRGANATDIAILVVAADDGVMPQTIEAINHAKAAGVEVIVAVNKIDKPAANIERVKQEMTEYELIPTDWGGSTEFVPVSAKTGEGMEELLETVLLTAEILELKADKKRKARGLVIEAQLDKGRGPVATILVQKGTLKVGDFVSAGASYGKVRAMIDDKGKRVKEAGPSMPVEILGLSDVPAAGEVFLAHDSDKTAKTYAETYQTQHKEQMLADTKARMSLDDLFSQIKEGDLKELNIIVKADVQGSVEAVKTSLMKLSNEEVVVKCIHGGVGNINESDVSLASASNAIIIGFNVRPDAQAKASAEHEKVDVRLYDVIYKAIEDVERAMKGMLDPIFEEKVIGHAEVRQIFRASAIGNIAGSYVMDGEFRRDCKVRISREGKQIFEGQLASLKRFKDDVKEVKSGFECGLVFEGFDQMQELDMVEAYIMVEVPRQ